MTQEAQVFQPGDLLTPKEAKAILPVSRTRIYDLCEAGEIVSFPVPSPKSGNPKTASIMILAESLQDYIQRQLLQGGKRRPRTEDVDRILQRVKDN